MNPTLEELVDRLSKLETKVSENYVTNTTQQVGFNYHAHTNFDGSAKLDLQKQNRFKRVLLVDMATIPVDATIGNHFYVTLKGNRTLSNPTGAAGGQKIVFEFIQDATGSRTVTLGSKFVFGTTVVSYTATTTANKRDFLGAIYSDLDDKFYVVALSLGY